MTFREWLLQQIAADVMRHTRSIDVLTTSTGDATAVATIMGVVVYDPREAIAECEAKRAILAEHRQVDGVCIRCVVYPIRYPRNTDQPCPTLRALGTAFATRAGYERHWRPL